MSESKRPPALDSQIEPAELPGLNGLLTLAVTVVVVGALYFGREVLIPITLAVLLSFVLAPIVSLLRRGPIGRIPAVILAVLGALAVIAVVAGLIGTQVAQLAGDMPRYMSTIEGKLDTVREFAHGRVFSVLGGLGKQIEEASAGGGDTKANPASNPTAAPPLPVELHQPPATPLELVRQILAPVVSPLVTAAIVFIVAIFILLQQEDLRDRLIRLFGADDLHRATSALDDAARRLSRYFLMQLALNALFGIVIGVGLFIIGVPNPVLWGIVALLCRFIPYVGTFLSAALPLVLAAAVDPGWMMLLWTACLFVISEAGMGQIVEPMVYGHSSGLSPVSVVVSAIFWGWLWGPIGLILAMPLTLCLVVLGRHIKRLEFIDVMLGDRPALTPVESFYQRMLAGDPDEAQDYAEILLRDRSLSSYYDEVAVKGLMLAASDAHRGVLAIAQVHRIEAALEELVDELAEHDDIDPSPAAADEGPIAPPAQERDLPKRPAPGGAPLDTDTLPLIWQSDSPVLCVSGRGPFDRGASMILAQLLGRHGMRTRIVSSDQVSRGAIANLDISGVALICVCQLEVTASASYLRYLLRRLRNRLPAAPVIVGLWPAELTRSDDERLRAAIGAEHSATSMNDFVTQSLEFAHAETVDAKSQVAAIVE